MRTQDKKELTMLEKIISIKNIGRFQNCNSAKVALFDRLNLVFASNGRGKTTFCALLYSLKSGDKTYITERKTLGQEEHPSVSFLVNGSNAKFDHDGWNHTNPNIEIYDSEFIHKNIYAGDSINHDHKKSLHGIIIGQEGVKLQNKYNDLDDQIKTANRDIRDAEIKAKEFIVGSTLSLELFLEFPEKADIDDLIEEKELEIDALNKASAIKNKSLLKTIQLPELPEDFETLLAEQIFDISPEVEDRVRDHLENHTKNATSRWISEGMLFAKDDECPFCGQNSAGLNLTEAYTKFFSLEYDNLKNKISELKEEVDSSLGLMARFNLDSTKSNQELQEFWGQFVTTEIPDLDFDNKVEPALFNLHSSAEELVEKKLAAPLDVIEPMAEFEAAQKGYEDAKKLVDSYNQAIEQANEIIKKKKIETDAGDLAKAKRGLEALKNTKARHGLDAKEACDKYKEALQSKEQLEAKKVKAKNNLDTYSAEIFEKYKDRINELLKSFGTGFRIGNVESKYVGGNASANFTVVINDCHVDIGKTNIETGQASFRTTLSAGDRNSLALAFFMAQLEELPDLANTIVVFDDPFTSLDQSRRAKTQLLICELTKSAKQIIVTSHDPHFLRSIYNEHYQPNEISTLQLKRKNKAETIIDYWDIKKETQSEYLKDLNALKNFHENGIGNGELVDIARKIRPVLEGYLRFLAPFDFEPKHWLKNLIENIRVAKPGTRLEKLKGDTFDSLTEINQFSKKYHHQDNPAGYVIPEVDEGELEAMVTQTLEFVGVL